MWIKPEYVPRAHFMYTPKDHKLAMRVSACKKLFLIGKDMTDGGAAHCKNCEKAIATERAASKS